MKEIKTVIQPIEYARYFDAIVNSLLADGWEVRRRGITTVQGQITESFNRPIEQVLYAEMERNNTPHPEEVTL